MKYLIVLILTAAMGLGVLPGASAKGSPERLDRTLRMLDKELLARGKYVDMRQHRADSLREVQEGTLRGSREWFDATWEIARTFSAYDNDSVLRYLSMGLEEARRLGIDSMVINFGVRHATYMSLSGLVHDAIYELEAIDTTAMSRATRSNYYSSTRQMFSYISTFYERETPEYDYWNDRAVEAQRNLVPTLEEGSTEYCLNLAEYYHSRHEYGKSKKILTSLLERINNSSREYAIACHILAEISRSSGDMDSYLYYLALSAISDTRRANREVTSIQELGGALFERGDTERAHRYLTAAMSNAVESHSAVRMGQISTLLSVVDKVHAGHLQKWRRYMWGGILLLIICVLALVVALWVLRRQLRKVQLMQRHLETANRTKEVYMSQFLTLCSVYMDKLKQLCNLTNCKIKAGQTEELYKITKSGKFIEEQTREFYSVFDNAFLHIYPDFLEKVNRLLRPEEQIRLEEGELLNSDLRILAFMRLGIDDATRVAQILNYSVNTIYAYRNKIRNRAINRATFEADIMAIQS